MHMSIRRYAPINYKRLGVFLARAIIRSAYGLIVISSIKPIINALSLFRRGGVCRWPALYTQ